MHSLLFNDMNKMYAQFLNNKLLRTFKRVTPLQNILGRNDETELIWKSTNDPTL